MLCLDHSVRPLGRIANRGSVRSWRLRRGSGGCRKARMLPPGAKREKPLYDGTVTTAHSGKRGC